MINIAGHQSFRHSIHGSWFIQALCDQLLKHFDQLDSVDIIRILTRVSRQVAFNMCSENTQKQSKMSASENA